MLGFVLIFAPKGVPQDSTTTRIAEVGRFRTTATSRWHDAAQHSTLGRWTDWILGVQLMYHLVMTNIAMV